MKLIFFQFSSVAQSCWLFVTPWTAARQASPSITNSQTLIKLMSIESVMPPNHLIFCRPPSPRVCNLSQYHGLFQWVSSSNKSVLRIRWPKYCNFSFSINPSNEYSWLISFRIDWFDLLALRGTQESSPTPQFKSINSSALSFLYSSILTSIHDYWKNHSFD